MDKSTYFKLQINYSVVIQVLSYSRLYRFGFSRGVTFGTIPNILLGLY